MLGTRVSAPAYRAFNKSNTQQKKAESKCQDLERSRLQSLAKTHPLLSKKTTCNINGNEYEVGFRDYSIREYAEKMFGNKNYWIKNAIIDKLPNYIKNSIFIESRAVDLTHNTNKRTLQLKRKLQWYHYLRTELPNGETAIIELVEYKSGEICFYTMVKTMPK